MNSETSPCRLRQLAFALLGTGLLGGVTVLRHRLGCLLRTYLHSNAPDFASGKLDC